MHSESGFRIAPKFPKIGKMTMTSQFGNMTLSSVLFTLTCFFFAKFSYWSKFHVNIITGSGVMTAFIYKKLTRNRKLEIPQSEF